MSVSPKRSTISGEGAAGMRCVWTYCAGGVLPEELDSNDDGGMWESMSTLGDTSHIEPKTILEEGPILSKECGLSEEDEAFIRHSINAALERARQRSSRKLATESRSSMRRSMVEASMITISQRDLFSSPPETPKPSPDVRKGGRKKLYRGVTA